MKKRLNILIISLLLISMIFLISCEREKVLVISPHPDDETLGAGLTMIRSLDLSVLVVTDGEPGENTGIDETRKNELLAAVAILNKDAKVEFLNFDDGDTLYYMPEIYDEIYKYLEGKNFNRVYVPAYEGGHVDHDVTHFAAVQALKKLNYHGKIYEYHLYNYNGRQVNYGDLGEVNNFVSANTMQEDFYFTDADLRLKQDMLDKFQSQPIQDRLWVDMVRRLPNFNYYEPPHQRPLMYELNQSEDRFENFTQAVDELYVKISS